MAKKKKTADGWSKQYAREQKYDRDFRYAEGSPWIGDPKYGKAKPLKGGLANPKNWPGGKSEMGHDPTLNRKYLDKNGNDTRKKLTVEGPTLGRKKAAKKKGAKKQSARKR